MVYVEKNGVRIVDIGQIAQIRVIYPDFSMAEARFDGRVWKSSMKGVTV